MSLASCESERPDQPLILLGAGGHAKVVLSVALLARFEVVGVCDPLLEQQGITKWRGIPVLGGDDRLSQLDCRHYGLLNGVGQLPDRNLRQMVYLKAKKLGFYFPVILHPQAWVDGSAQLAEGAQVMAGAMIQPDCLVGENTIINTRSSIDHDCHIGNHVHVAPGATLCGTVTVQDGAFIGAGATIIQGLTIPSGSLVRAGSVLIRDLPHQ